MTGSKQVDHWTSGTVYECSEIAGTPQLPSSSSPGVLIANYASEANRELWAVAQIPQMELRIQGKSVDGKF
jgi:hypothetical protein